MQIIEKDINEIFEYDNNPRNNEPAVDKVMASIKEFGFKVPIIIDKDNVIVAGHTRYKASKMLELQKVPCIVADDLTEEQVKAFRVADNKVAEFSNWDFVKLQQELDELELNFNMSVFGFANEVSNVDIDNFFTETESKPKEPKTITCPHCGEIIEL